MSAYMEIDPSLMEPLMPEDKQHRLENLAFDLATKSQGLALMLNGEVVRSIADLVRSMNCYYSNLIEGHNTHPANIERALRDDYSDDPEIRDLQSYACLKELGIGSALWSVARGLGRNVQEYKLRLQAADMPRQDGLDGRGNLSLKGLEAFCEFFLTVCIDQVDYMQSILKPNELMRRIALYCRDEVDAGRLMKGSNSLLREALLGGSFERGRAPAITGYADRQARKVMKSLLDRGLLLSDSPKGIVRLGFPEYALESWLPRLYPAA